MKQTDKPKALLLISSHCPHCHTLEMLLQDCVANGTIKDLNVINIELSPEMANQYGVRSVPWLQLNEFIFNEALTPTELDSWVEYIKDGSAQSHYIRYLLEHAKLTKAIEWIGQGNTTLAAVIPFLGNPDAKMNVRVGIGAILEHFEASQAIKAIIPELIILLDHSDPTIRTDVCYYLSLTHSKDAVEPLKKMLTDEDQQVREIAKESIESLTE